jgi:hypothetical protein
MQALDYQPRRPVWKPSWWQPLLIAVVVIAILEVVLLIVVRALRTEAIKAGQPGPQTQTTQTVEN